MNVGHRARDERGETLVESLVTVTILGTVVVAVMFGLATAVNLSKTQRDRADAAVVLAAAADAVDSATYVPCPGVSTASYDPTAGVTLPSGWSSANVRVVAVRAWDGAAFSACASTDRGLQLVTVEVRAPGDDETRRVDVLKRGVT